METIKLVLRDEARPRADLQNFCPEEAQKARCFHAGFAQYAPTPLTSLPNLAQKLGVDAIQVKDESFRFGLNAFKVLGGSYALGRYIAQTLGEDIADLPAQRILSPEVREKLGDVTFITATDGNHGRGVAWTARQLGQKAVVYMPEGSAKERLENIRSEGARADILPMNYDDAVRLAARRADQFGWVMVQDTAWEGYTDIPLWIMQGYTTMGAELAEQLEQPPTHLFLQAGVGSMAGAMAGFFASLYGEARPKIVIVEPQKADCLFRTAKANDGKLHPVRGKMNTIMAGLACGEPCTIGWQVLESVADAFLSVRESVAADGMRVLASPCPGDSPIISGESGAAAFGAAVNVLLDEDLKEIREKLDITAQSRLLFISTEGDTDKKNWQNVVWRGKYPGVK